MKRNDGIVIISSLILMVAILGLAVGSLFLTNANLSVANNIRSKAVAKYSAEAGMDATLVAFNDYYKQHGEYPTYNANSGSFSSFSLPTVQLNGSVVNYSVKDFTTTGDSAVLKVSSVLPNGAEHISEVLMAASLGSTVTTTNVIVDPLVANGLQSEGTISLNGRSNFVNAGLHGNSGYTLNGFNRADYSVCLARSSTGLCTSSQTIAAADLPITAAAGLSSYTCNPNDAAVCQSNTPVRLVDSITVTPNYASRRDAAISAADLGTGVGTYSNVFGINCSLVLTSIPNLNNSRQATAAGFTSGNTICVENGNVTLPSGFGLDDVTIIAKNQIQFNGNGGTRLALKDSLLVSTNGCINVNPNKVTISSTSMYSNCDLNLNGQQTSFEGIVTLASNSSININGSSTVHSIDGSQGIGLGLIAEQNIAINGNSNWFAVAITGGTFNYNGRATLVGGVSSKGSININGGIDIDSGLTVFNEEFLIETTTTTTGVAQELTEYSRR